MDKLRQDWREKREREHEHERTQSYETTPVARPDNRYSLEPDSPSKASPKSHLSGASFTNKRLSGNSLLRSLSEAGEGVLKKLSPYKEKPDPIAIAEELEPKLRRALDLLELPDLDALEIKFLQLDALIVPWTHFRDSFLLFVPNNMPRASLPKQVTRRSILDFYTYYNNNELRFDPKSDPWDARFTRDTSKYGIIDKSTWTVVDHEKLLYAWLLQTFAVGKKKNHHGFTYFELRNICTAWDEVFEPIVTAVRDAYHPKGRWHYGRLAKFIENVSPSRIAFPESNIGVASSPRASPAKSVASTTSSIDLKTGWRRKVTRAEARAELETELRRAYPMYGAMIERPIVKQSLPDWIQAQKDRRAAAKASGASKPDVEPDQQSSEPSPEKQSPAKQSPAKWTYTDELRAARAGKKRADNLPPTDLFRDHLTIDTHRAAETDKIRQPSYEGTGYGPLTPPPTFSEGKTALGHRIVSIENIRGALSLSSSEESLQEALRAPTSKGTGAVGFAGMGGRGMNTGEVLKTHNQHMFPRSRPSRGLGGKKGVEEEK